MWLSCCSGQVQGTFRIRSREVLGFAQRQFWAVLRGNSSQGSEAVLACLISRSGLVQGLVKGRLLCRIGHFSWAILGRSQWAILVEAQGTF